MSFLQKLAAIQTKNNSLVCVGLDPDFEKLPERFRKTIHPQFTFNKWIIDQTYDFVSCYKPNSAFYEARGVEGIAELKATGDYIREKHPDVPVLLDFKRGDIGNTNEAYAQFAFDYLQVDAVTVNPYQGGEALEPFFKYKDKGIFILCKTSNPGSGEFQNSIVNARSDPPEAGQTLYEYVAYKVTKEWNKNNNCFLVVGATYPKELARIRQIADDMTILVPGVGAQEGELEKTLKAGLNSQKRGMIINASRSILFTENPRESAQQMKSHINGLR